MSSLVGIILVTHGKLAVEFQAAVEHVVGPQEQMVSICIAPDDDSGVKTQEIRDAIVQMDSGAGVVILTDLFGGTPANLALAQMVQGKIEVIAGVNLPLLIKLVSLRDQPLSDIIQPAIAAGQKYLIAASGYLPQ